MHLNPGQIAPQHREDYVLIRGLVPAVACAAVHAHALLLGVPKTDGGACTPMSLNHEQPDADPALHRRLTEPCVLGAIEHLLGADPRVLWGMVGMVPLGDGRGLPWHQDNQYAHVLNCALNTFIAVSNIAPEQYTLLVARRSHR